MTVTTWTLTGDVSTMVGDDWPVTGSTAAEAYLTAYDGDGPCRFYVDTSTGGKVRFGPTIPVTLASDGTFTVASIPDSSETGLSYTFTLTYRPAGHGRTRAETTDRFTLDANKALNQVGFVNPDFSDAVILSQAVDAVVGPLITGGALTNAAVDTVADERVALHTADTVDAHDATAVSYAGSTGLTAANVETALDELAIRGGITAPAATGSDQTTALQALLDAGGRVHLGAGTYVLASGLTLNPDTASLVGHPDGTTLSFTGMTSGTAIAIGKPTSRVVRRVTPLSDLTISGPTAGATTVTGLALGSATTWANNLTFESVLMTGFRDQLVFGDNAFINEWHHCTFTANVRNSIRAEEHNSANENELFLFCTFSENAGPSVYVSDAGATFHFTSCSFDYSGDLDIDLRAGLAIATDCYFEASDSSVAVATERIKLTPTVDNQPPVLKIKGGSVWPFWTVAEIGTFIRISGDTSAVANNAVVSIDGTFVRTASAATTRYLIRDDRSAVYTAASGNVDKRSKVSVRDLTYKEIGSGFGVYAPLIYRDINGIEWQLDAGVDYGQVGDLRGTPTAWQVPAAHVIETMPRLVASARRQLTSGDLFVVALPRSQAMFRASAFDLMCAFSTQGNSITTAQFAIYDAGRNYAAEATWSRLARGYFTANAGSDTIRTSSVTQTIGFQPNNNLYLAVLVVSTGNMPFLWGRTVDTTGNPLLSPTGTLFPRISGKLTGQTDMPTTLDPASLVNADFVPWLAIKPTTYA